MQRSPSELDSLGKRLTEPRSAHGMGRREVLPAVSGQGTNVAAEI
jgi:hypothetical protein